MTMRAPAIVWFFQDLRLDDQPALAAALAAGRPIVPVFVLDTTSPGAWAPGGASRVWLHGSLTALGADLAARGARLVLRRGVMGEELLRLAEETGAAEIHGGRAVEPWLRAAIAALRPALARRGVVFHEHETRLLFAPERLKTQNGGAFSVFTPFARAAFAAGIEGEAWPAPATLPGFSGALASDDLATWRLAPTRPDWAAEMRRLWTPGAAGAAARLARFLTDALPAYDRARDIPGHASTSMLSPHLHWGEISPRRVWQAASSAAPAGGKPLHSFLNELLWREFSAYLLWHHPHLPEQPLRAEFAAMPWREDGAARAAWQRGETGIPIVDAGMRQLWRWGWMHNRVRMIAASFLVKHLLLPWQAGEAWFWDTLLDADLAANAASWQWVAGSGADAAPYFRIFNPILQGRKFDPEGAYVRRFVPELAALPDEFIHAPWEAPGLALRAAGIELGKTYPRPIIDLGLGRARALAAFAALPRRAA